MSEDNVIYLIDVLHKRYSEALVEFERLRDTHESLSKQSKDKFAAPVESKRDAAYQIALKYYNQLEFVTKAMRRLEAPEPTPTAINVGSAVPVMTNFSFRLD